MATTKMRILSIDAWREPEGGWTWNQWHEVGTLDAATDADAAIINETAWRAALGNRKAARACLAALRRAGILSRASAGKVALDGNGHADPYTLSLCKRGNMRPMIAIEFDCP